MTPLGLALRAAAIVFIVFTFYNPTAYCFTELAYHSLLHTPDRFTVAVPLIVLGLACYVALAAYLIRSTHNGIGVWGVLLVAFVLAGGVWAIDYFLHLQWSVRGVVWAIETSVSLIFLIGLIFPALNRRVSGQVTTTQAAAIDAHVHHG